MKVSLAQAAQMSIIDNGVILDNKSCVGFHMAVRAIGVLRGKGPGWW